MNQTNSLLHLFLLLLKDLDKFVDIGMWLTKFFIEDTMPSLQLVIGAVAIYVVELIPQLRWEKSNSGINPGSCHVLSRSLAERFFVDTLHTSARLRRCIFLCYFQSYFLFYCFWIRRVSVRIVFAHQSIVLSYSTGVTAFTSTFPVRSRLYLSVNWKKIAIQFKQLTASFWSYKFCCLTHVEARSLNNEPKKEEFYSSNRIAKSYSWSNWMTHMTVESIWSPQVSSHRCGLYTSKHQKFYNMTGDMQLRETWSCYHRWSVKW